MTAEVAPDEAFFTLRSRAYELADTGRYKEWTQIAYALLAEGFLPSNIKRFDADALAVMLVTRSCQLKNPPMPSPAARIRKWFG
jgi:hypothetical protein